MRRAFVVAVLLTAPAPAVAQTAADRLAAFDAPRWMTAWSPFNALADLPSTLPAAHPAPDLLGAPSPRIGLWWTAGIPGALPFDVTDTRLAIRGGLGHESGDYRRAMDPTAEGILQATGLAWQPMDQGAAAGRVIVDREEDDGAPFGASLLPYASDPFVTTDTATPATRRVRARLEGAIGRVILGFGVGLTAGVEEDDHRTIGAPVPRFDRNALPAVSGGIVRRVLGLLLGAYGRWQGGSETLSVLPYTANGDVFSQTGFVDPDTLSVSVSSLYFRRSDDAAHALGLGVAGSLLGADWVLYGENTTRHDDHFSARLLGHPTDTWDADGRVWGGAVQRYLFGEHTVFTGEIRRTTLAGDAHRSDLTGVIFHADESALEISTELRYAPPDGAWSLALAYHVTREHRNRYDYIAAIGEDLVQWTPTGSFAIARRMGNTSVSVGAAAAAYTALGAVPDATALGTVYQQVTAPGMTLDATRALPMNGTLSLGQRLASGTLLLAQLRYETAGPVGAAPSLPFPPQGTRNSWSVLFGVRTN